MTATTDDSSCTDQGLQMTSKADSGQRISIADRSPSVDYFHVPLINDSSQVLQVYEQA